MREYYDLELKQLNDQMIEFGAIIETAIKYATDALLNKDLEKADKVKKYEKQSNKKEKEIESFCFRILLHQHPVASDLRVVSSALKMITDMERIADQSRDIADLTRHLSRSSIDTDSKHIIKMSGEASKMVTRGIDSFVNKDVVLAQQVIDNDDIVDEMFNIVRKDVTNSLKENALESDYALDLFMSAKYYERIADHAVNIAEWVIYSITGSCENLKIDTDM